MRTVIVSACAIASLLVAILVSVQVVNSDDYFGSPGAEPTRSAYGTPATIPPIQRVSPLAPPAAQAGFRTAPQAEHQLGARYIELARKHAAVLDEEGLLAEIAVLEMKIGERVAAQQVGSAREILQTVLKEYPDSDAAERARSMLGIRTSIANPAGDPEALRVDGPEVLETRPEADNRPGLDPGSDVPFDSSGPLPPPPPAESEADLPPLLEPATK